MKRFVIILLMVLILGLAAFWWFNQAPPAPKAADLLPDSTMLLLELPYFARARAEFAKTAASALWQEPQMQQFVQELQRNSLESFGAPKGQRHVSLLSFLDPARGEVFLAVTGTAAQSPFGFKALLGLDVQQNLLLTRIALAYRELRIRGWNRHARFYTKERAGIRYRVWELGPRVRLHHAFLNSLLVYTFDEDALHALIDRFTGQVPKSFTPMRAAPGYQEALGRLRPAPEFVAYLNPTLLPKTWPVSHWLSRAEVIVLGTTVLDNQIRDLTYSVYSTPQTVFPPLTRFQSIVLTAPHTTFYRVSLTDWEESYRAITTALAKSDNTNLSRFAPQFERTLLHNGIRPNEDLFNLLGPETAVLANWREGASIPEIALVVELRNSNSMRLRLDVAMTALKDTVLASDKALPWDIAQFHGETLRTARLNTTIVAPTYFTTDNFFVLASTPDYARELVSQLKELVPTLAMNTDYQQAMKQFPTNITASSYCNLRAIVPPLLAHAQAGLRAFPNRFIHADSLPSAEVVTRHLTAFASATITDNRSTTTIAISPLGKPATATLGALAVFLAIQPYFQPNPAAPTTSSNTVVHPPPSENQTATSPAPSPR